MLSGGEYRALHRLYHAEPRSDIGRSRAGRLRFADVAHLLFRGCRVGPLFLENVFRRCLHAGRYDRFGSGYDAAELELPLTLGFADQYRDYGFQPNGGDPAFSGARRAALPLCGTCRSADAREGRSTVRRSRRERWIAACRWYYVRCGAYIEYLFICRGCHDGIDDFVHRGYLARSEALGRRAADAGAYRGACRNGARDGVRGPLFRPVR